MIEARIDPDFGIEFDSVCSYDYLRFYSSNSTTSIAFRFARSTKLCGSVAPNVTIQSTHRSMTVFFYTDDSVNDRGFKIYYKSVANNSRTKRDTETLRLWQTETTHEQKTADETIGKPPRTKRRISGALKTDKVNWILRKKRSYQNGAYNWVTQGCDLRFGYDYDYADDYDYDYCSDFNSHFSYYADDDYNYDLFGNFDDNLTHYDWAAAYDKSTSTDYSDFKPFVLFSKEEMTYLGTQAKDFIVQCTFDGRECTHQDFHRGAFFSFSAETSSNYIKIKPGVSVMSVHS